VVPLFSTLPVMGVAIWCVWAAHTVPEPFDCFELPSTFSLLPPLIITAASALPSSAPLPLLPVSPSVHPQPTICLLGSLLLAPSSPPCRAPSSLWLCLGSFFPLPPPWSSVAPAQPRPFRNLTSTLELSAPPWPSGSSASPWLFVSPSLPRASPPPALPPSVIHLDPSSTMASPAVGRLHGYGLGPTWVLLLQVPPVFFPWLLPPSDSPWLLLSLFWLLPPLSPPWTLFVVHPPPEPPPV
ncbi:hypothetical protein M9458_023337, partial [Cirrhinus mrigala]